MIHFLQDACLKCMKGLPRRRWKVGIACHPCPRGFRIHLFNLLPAQTFPLPEVNLSQCGPYHLRYLSNSSDRVRRRAGPAQVAAINSIDRLRGELVGQRSKLRAPLGVQLRVGMTAKPPRHLRLRMANKYDAAHGFHPPQRYTAISVIWVVAPKQSPVTPPNLRR